MSVPRVEAILFDFFGTLVHYDPSGSAQGYPATHALQGQAGIGLSYDAFLRAWASASEELDAWSRLHEREFSMDDVAQRFLARVAPERDAAELRGALWRSYVSEWERGIAYIPGVRELIDALATRFKLAVVTNTHWAPLVARHLDAIGVRNRFDFVLSSVEHGRPKPHPSIFEAALARLTCPPQRALFVGDSHEADYLGATRAGLHALLIDPTRDSPAPREHRIASILELGARLAGHHPRDAK
jgi:putative hydrolase of the HAD superfamily